MVFDSQILAKMHALGISMRRKRPQIFNSKILPYLQTFPRKNLANFFNVSRHPLFKTNLIFTKNHRFGGNLNMIFEDMTCALLFLFRSLSMSWITFSETIQRKCLQQLENSTNLGWHIYKKCIQLIIHHLQRFVIVIYGLQMLWSIRVCFRYSILKHSNKSLTNIRNIFR